MQWEEQRILMKVIFEQMEEILSLLRNRNWFTSGSCDELNPKNICWLNPIPLKPSVPSHGPSHMRCKMNQIGLNMAAGGSFRLSRFWSCWRVSRTLKVCELERSAIRGGVLSKEKHSEYLSVWAASSCCFVVLDGKQSTEGRGRLTAAKHSGNKTNSD